jgi:hypothetical protein
MTCKKSLINSSPYCPSKSNLFLKFGALPIPLSTQARETGVHVKRRHILTITALTLSFLAACGTTQPKLIQEQGLPIGSQTAPGSGDRLGALAITNLFQETSLAAWSKKANVTLTDLNGFTKVGITDTTTGWTSRAIPTSSAGDTYTATLEVKGTGTIQFFLQKGGGDFAQYTNKIITLTGTATTITITTLKPADGFALQVGMTNITSGNNLEARNLLVTKGVTSVTPPNPNQLVNIESMAGSSWVKGGGIVVVDGDATWSRLSNAASGGYINQRSAVVAAGKYAASVELYGSGTVQLAAQKGGGDYALYATTSIALTATPKKYTLVFDKPNDTFPIQFLLGDVASGEKVYARTPSLATSTATNGLTSATTYFGRLSSGTGPTDLVATVRPGTGINGTNGQITPQSVAPWLDGNYSDHSVFSDMASQGIPPYETDPVNNSDHKAFKLELKASDLTRAGTQQGPYANSGVTVSDIEYTKDSFVQGVEYAIEFDMTVPSSSYNFAQGGGRFYFGFGVSNRTQGFDMEVAPDGSIDIDGIKLKKTFNNLADNKTRHFRLEFKLVNTTDGFIRLWIDGESQFSPYFGPTTSYTGGVPITFGFDVGLSGGIAPAGTAASLWAENLKIYTKIGSPDLVDIFKQPFSLQSIWNTPVTSLNANWVKPEFTGTDPNKSPLAPETIKLSEFNTVIFERNYIYRVAADTVKKNATVTLTAGSYDLDGAYRCGKKVNGKYALDNNGNEILPRDVGTYTIPADTKIPDDNKNNATAFLNLIDKKVYQLNAACRTDIVADKIYAQEIYRAPDVNSGFENDLEGEGIYGAQGGTRLTAAGGAIRAGELYGPDPIRHALKVTVFAHRLLYRDKINFSNSWKWPADTVDGYAFADLGKRPNGNASSFSADEIKHAYNVNEGILPALKVGALLALKTVPTTLTTKAGNKIAEALVNYGAYIADDSYCNCFNIAVEGNLNAAGQSVVEAEMALTANDNIPYSAKGEASGAFLTDMQTIATNLFIVADNGKWTRGGAGIFRQGWARATPKY